MAGIPSNSLSINQSPAEYQRFYRETHRDELNAYSREWAKENRERSRATKRRSRQKVRDLYEYFISQLTCEGCGKSAAKVNQWNLYFHHREPSELSFRIGLCDHSWNAILKESEKCDVLCASCHNKAHNRKTGADGRFLKAVM